MNDQKPLRNVQVDLVVPAKSNHRMADIVRHRAMRDLAEAGARIRLVPRMIHAKAVVVDDSRVLGAGSDVAGWLAGRATVRLCAMQVGVLERALELTAEHARTRVQFGRPIGAFEATQGYARGSLLRLLFGDVGYVGVLSLHQSR